jgi:hypothetical protein
MTNEERAELWRLREREELIESRRFDIADHISSFVSTLTVHIEAELKELHKAVKREMSVLKDQLKQLDKEEYFNNEAD